MNIFKKLYRDYFGLNETAVHPVSITPSKLNDPAVQAAIKSGTKFAVEEELDEAQLLNKISDYRGGVEFVVQDPEQSAQIADTITQWAAKKGISLIKKTISKSGRVVYMYFRIGQDPVSDSQKLQGYISQRPDIKHFRFNVRAQKPEVKQLPPAKI